MLCCHIGMHTSRFLVGGTLISEFPPPPKSGWYTSWGQVGGVSHANPTYDMTCRWLYTHIINSGLGPFTVRAQKCNVVFNFLIVSWLFVRQFHVSLGIGTNNLQASLHQP